LWEELADDNPKKRILKLVAQRKAEQLEKARQIAESLGI
jgi:hypothetical protein